MLNNFSSFFEIFAGLNLAYAGSEIFRNSIDESISKLIKTAVLPNIEITISEAISTITVISQGDNISVKARDKLLSLQEQLELRCKQLQLEEKENNDFPNGFKSMFLITGFYCLTLLVLGGYEQIWLANSQEDKTAVIFLLLCLPILLFNIFIFIRSFTKVFFANIKPFITVGYLLFWIILCVLTLQYCPAKDSILNWIPENSCIGYCLIVAVSPYIIHFIKAFLHKTIFTIHLVVIRRKLKKEINKIDKAIKVFYE